MQTPWHQCTFFLATPGGRPATSLEDRDPQFGKPRVTELMNVSPQTNRCNIKNIFFLNASPSLHYHHLVVKIIFEALRCANSPTNGATVKRQTRSITMHAPLVVNVRTSKSTPYGRWKCCRLLRLFVCGFPIEYYDLCTYLSFVCPRLDFSIVTPFVNHFLPEDLETRSATADRLGDRLEHTYPNIELPPPE